MAHPGAVTVTASEDKVGYEKTTYWPCNKGIYAHATETTAALRMIPMTKPFRNAYFFVI